MCDQIMPLGTQRSIVRELRNITGPTTNAELAEVCGYGISTIQRNIRDLLNAGVIKRKRVGTPGQRSWRYQYTILRRV